MNDPTNYDVAAQYGHRVQHQQHQQQDQRRISPALTSSPNLSPSLPSSPQAGGGLFTGLQGLGGMPPAYQNGLQRYPVYLKQGMPGHLSVLHGQVPSTSQGIAGVSVQAATAPPPAMPITAATKYHEEQLKVAVQSRNSSGPHYHARAAAFHARQNPAVASLSDSGVSSSVNSLILSSMDKMAAALAAANAETTPSQQWSALDMGGMGLNNVSSSLFRYTFLTTLYLNHNNLSKLPPEFALLRNLTILDVSGNKLTSLPPELGMLTKLKELLLCDNSIATIPFELGTLYQLQTIALEGNPLNEGCRSMLQKDGTQALIAYLRDNMPAPPSPPDREWIQVEIDDGDPNDAFTVLDYNVLAGKYATSGMYGYTPPWILSWTYRREAIMTELQNLQADIVCLQEIEAGQYEEFFRVQLAQLGGYESVFWPKSRAKTMTEWERRTVDGCATFFKSSKFKLIDRHLVEFSQLALQREDFRRTEEVFNRMMNKDNIAVLTLLENRENGMRLLVANAHIHWDPHYRDVKLVQVAMLMEELRKWAAKCVKMPPSRAGSISPPRGRRTSPSTAATSAAAKASEGPPQLATFTTLDKLPMVICGDFNSLVNSGVYQFLSCGSVQQGHDDFGKHAYGSFTSDGLSHPFSLKSAYSGEHKLPFTNHTPTFSDVIDYIWYTTNTLAPIGLLGAIDKAYMSQVVGLPNFHFPSDHVCLLAEFRVKHAAPVGASSAQQQQQPSSSNANHAHAAKKPIHFGKQ